MINDRANLKQNLTAGFSIFGNYNMTKKEEDLAFARGGNWKRNIF